MSVQENPAGTPSDKSGPSLVHAPDNGRNPNSLTTGTTDTFARCRRHSAVLICEDPSGAKEAPGIAISAESA